jgi:hypothetical protein
VLDVPVLKEWSRGRVVLLGGTFDLNGSLFLYNGIIHEGLS